MNLKQFHIFKEITHVLLVLLSMVFSVILFSQFSDTFFSLGVYVVLGVALEMFKIFLLVEAKFYLFKMNWHIITAIILFLIYFSLATISGIATMGFNLNTINSQSFSAGIANIETDTLLFDIEAINQEIQTKIRQQSELPTDYVTASDRYTRQIQELRAEREALLSRIETGRRQTVSQDTFTLLGQEVGLSGERTLYIILAFLTVILEIGIAVTSGNLKKSEREPKDEQEDDMAGFLDIPKEKPLPKVKPQKRAAGCESCLLYRNCQTPKIPVQGKGEAGVLVLFDYPTRREDHRRQPFNELHHQYIFSILQDLGYNEDDVWVRHAVQCHPGDDKPTPQSIEGCHFRLMKDLETLKPNTIIVAGETAMKVLYNNVNSGRFSFARYNRFPGFVIPDQELKSVIVPIHPPVDAMQSLIRRRKVILSYNEEQRFNPKLWMDKKLKTTDEFRVYDRFIRDQIKNGLDAEWKEYGPGEVRIVKEHDEVITVIRYLLSLETFAFDIETTGLKPYAEGHKIHSWGFSNGKITYSFPHFEDDRFIRLMRRLMTNDARKIGANIKFEHNWIRHFLGVEINNWFFDIVLGAHILDNREGITSLKFQTFVNLGIAGYDHEIDPFIKAAEKGGNNLNNIDKAPIDKVLWYVGLDASYTFQIASMMYAKIAKDPHRKPGYDLFHKGQQTLADMEFRGFVVDSIQLAKNYKELEKKEFVLYDQIKKSKEVVDWPDFNPNSNKHLIELFYERLGFPVDERTKAGDPSTKSEVIENFHEVHGCEIAKYISEYKDVVKTKDTFLMGIKRETDRNMIHPSFSLNLVSSYRSSSQDPNFQNLPKRNEEAMKMIKSVMKPREGFVIMDVDYVSLEGFMGCNYHQDSMMQTYLLDENTDMHSDMTEDLFMCKREDIDEKLFKSMRRVGKTGNFALQYGSSAYKLGQNLWNSHLTYEHKDFLAQKGIDSYDLWIDHCKEIYRIYWEERFGELNQWRSDSWEEYIKTGKSISNMGFTYNSLMSKNQVGNFRIQGSGFNILMLGINLMTDIMKERNMKSGFIAEVHDSIVLEVAEDEIEEVKQLVQECFITKIKEMHPWIAMPLRMTGEIYRNSWAEYEETFNLAA